MNVAHDVFLPRRGAGSMPCSLRIRLMVLRPISCPPFLRAPRRRVYPSLNFRGHPDQDPHDLGWLPGATGAALGAAVVLLGDEGAVPAEDCVRAGDACDIKQPFAAEFVSPFGETTSFRVGETDPTAELLPEDPVLLLQVVDQAPLVACHPGRDPRGEELNRQ